MIRSNVNNLVVQSGVNPGVRRNFNANDSANAGVRRNFNDDRLQLSVHYASTPTLVNTGANSVEENSVNSEDFEISSSSSQNSSR